MLERKEPRAVMNVKKIERFLDVKDSCRWSAGASSKSSLSASGEQPIFDSSSPQKSKESVKLSLYLVSMS